MRQRPSLDAWKAAVASGRASEFCDRIVATRPPPPKLLTAIFGLSDLPLTEAQVQETFEPKQERPLLSQRQREVLSLLAAGRRMKEVAATLGVSHNTANEHLKIAKRRLEANGITSCVATAIRRGYI